MNRRAVVAVALVIACGVVPAIDVPPLGVSMSETIVEASVELAQQEPHEAGVFKMQRVDSCTIPAFIANDAAGPAVMSDLTYGDDDHQKYDLALPENENPRALIVIIHGGGWTAGTKALFRPTIRTLASVGYAAASVEYRLARDDRRKFPAGLADVRCAIRSARERVKAKHLIIIGASAGGHLAAMVETLPEAPRYDGECADRSPIHVDGAILYYAPLELERARERYVPIMQQATSELLYGARAVADGGIDASSRDWLTRAHEVTPRHAIDSHVPPTLLLNGLADTIVPIEDARDYRDALAAAGVPVLLVELSEQKHGFAVLGRKPELQPASCSVLHFLEQIAAL